MSSIVMAFAAAVAGLTGCGSGIPGLDPNVYVVDVTDRKEPPPTDDGFSDDRLADKKTVFDPELVDRRPLEGWLVNQSESVLRLDIPIVQPDYESHLLVLHPSYRDAMKAARADSKLLPSVNLLDGKAKQFDDGLYAALDLLHFQGLPEKFAGNQKLVQRLLEKVDPASPTAPYLSAGLTLGGQETSVGDSAARQAWIDSFRRDAVASKPIGFYTWNDDLKRCWAFMRFFQQPLEPADPKHRALIAGIVAALEADDPLKADYMAAAQFFGKLTNPLDRLSMADIVGIDLSSEPAVDGRRKSLGIESRGVAFFPPSTSRETELFKRLFPLGTPPNANLMRELVQAIRSGKVDLAPRPNSGWYDHQVYALETLLLPEKGEEHDKLLLTKPYKKRMLEAFAALITKRRETHSRQANSPMADAAPAPRKLEVVTPRLRVEPCPSFYLRTARSYSFLSTFLAASIGDETLSQLHGLRQAGPRAESLAAELDAQRKRFYGLYLISCDDIGLKPTLADGEVENSDECYSAAEVWLEKLADETDLAEDTRVAIPIYVDPFKGTMRLWVTLGVRLSKLEVRYEKAPRVKPEGGDGEWQIVENYKLRDVEHLIAVDEFAEVEVKSLTPPNRDELRRLCDQHKTKEKIVEALSAGRW
ncbi:MAG TPA: hypothetical protein PLV92_05790 [Pirellulaceae bacterium]|nr:hypothetical protein [Pirellulaceae bacterium]